MGLKIDLPIMSIEEAVLLDETLRLRSEALNAAADMIHTTEDERIECLQKANALDLLRRRLNTRSE